MKNLKMDSIIVALLGLIIGLIVGYFSGSTSAEESCIKKFKEVNAAHGSFDTRFQPIPPGIKQN
jgi:hypothetical protein